jgi:FdhD protein
MIASGNDLEDFALGFSVSEGLISGPENLYDVSLLARPEGVIVDLQISQRDFQHLKEIRRNVQGRSGCGLCGHESLTAAFAPLSPMAGRQPPPEQHFFNIRERIKPWQAQGAESGALHAALLMNEAGDILMCREDIGRHNALDKLLGAAIKEPIDLSRSTVVMTSRCSIELVRKAIRSGLSTLATLASPSSLSVSVAREHRLNLIHISRLGEARLYSRGDSI